MACARHESGVAPDLPMEARQFSRVRADRNKPGRNSREPTVRAAFGPHENDKWAMTLETD